MKKVPKLNTINIHVKSFPICEIISYLYYFNKCEKLLEKVLGGTIFVFVFFFSLENNWDTYFQEVHLLIC